MPLFGQVWLWSLLAFIVGALVTWVLLVLPIRKRIYALERRLATVRAETKAAAPAAPERPAPPQPPATGPPRHAQPQSASSIVPGFGEDEIRAESLTRAYAMPGLIDTPVTPPTEEAEERGALRLSGDSEPPPADVTEYIGSQGMPLVAPRQPSEPTSTTAHGWFEDEVEPEPVLPAQRSDPNLVDDGDDSDDRGTVFTQRTDRIPAELIRELDESSRPPEPPEPQRDDSLVDDLTDEPEEPAAAPEPAGQHAMSGADTVIVNKNGALPTELTRTPELEPAPPAPEPEPMPEPVATERPEERIRVTANNKNTMRAPIIELNKPLELDRTQSVLPKRVPSKPQHRAPFGVQTTSPAITTPAVATDTPSERMRSLFEPVIPAESSQQNDVLPPPHRLHSTDSRPSTPGPFGPGSAMPLPGGASPSPEFTVKASVTALRYCTPESPQFGKTVAEVWFRSAADAERVGFRPVG